MQPTLLLVCHVFFLSFFTQVFFLYLFSKLSFVFLLFAAKPQSTESRHTQFSGRQTPAWMRCSPSSYSQGTTRKNKQKQKTTSPFKSHSGSVHNQWQVMRGLLQQIHLQLITCQQYSRLLYYRPKPKLSGNCK